jgi:hypothetical protein
MDDKEILAIQQQLASGEKCETIQGLWGGYGKIVRVLQGQKQFVVKHMSAETKSSSNDISHQRKLRSYEVEHYFYTNYACLLPRNDCIVPQLFHGRSSRSGTTSEMILIIEDLKELGLGGSNLARKQSVFSLSALARQNDSATVLAGHDCSALHAGKAQHRSAESQSFSKSRCHHCPLSPTFLSGLHINIKVRCSPSCLKCLDV